LYLENATGCNGLSNTCDYGSNSSGSNISAVNNPICVGGNLAQLTSTVTGGAGTTTYQWRAIM
jgi:hypothetical protein